MNSKLSEPAHKKLLSLHELRSAGLDNFIARNRGCRTVTMGKLTFSSYEKINILRVIRENNRQLAVKNGKIGVAKLTSE